MSASDLKAKIESEIATHHGEMQNLQGQASEKQEELKRLMEQKNTPGSEMSEEERKQKIDQLNSEMQTLMTQMQFQAGNASAYQNLESALNKMKNMK